MINLRIFPLRRDYPGTRSAVIRFIGSRSPIRENGSS
jgi:hypothetical protein